MCDEKNVKDDAVSMVYRLEQMGKTVTSVEVTEQKIVGDIESVDTISFFLGGNSSAYSTKEAISRGEMDKEIHDASVRGGK